MWLHGREIRSHNPQCRWQQLPRLKELMMEKLTHCAQEYFEKLTFKGNKKRNFKPLYLKSQDEFPIKTKMFINFIQFTWEEGGFLHTLHTWVHDSRSRSLQPLVPLPAPRMAKRVNDEPVEVLNLLFLIYFCSKWVGTFFCKTAVFSFWTEAMFLLNPFSPGLLWKIGILEKQKTQI